MDTRLVPRIVVQMKLLIRVEEKPGQIVALGNGKFFDAVAMDISEGGLCLIVKYYLPKGTSVEISMPGDPFDRKEEVKFLGEIRYCKNHKDNTYKCGIKIDKISRESAAAINAFIAKYDKRQKPRLRLPD